MTKARRKLALLTAIAVLFVMLSSVAFIVAEAKHDCSGAGCQICHQITVCENTLRQFSLAVTVVSIAAALIYLSLYLTPIVICAQEHTTLITLKVKLSN